MAATPVGFLVSLIGVFIDRDKKAALVGLILTAAIAGLMLITTLC
jgi:hypothetical protein